MKKKLIRAAVVIAAVALVYAAAVFIGRAALAGSQPISDGDLTARMRELIPAAEEINEIVWGAGLPVDPDAAPLLDSVTGAQYRFVSPEAKYQSLDELRAAAAAVYSDAFIRDHIAYVAFDGYEPQNGESDLFALSPRYTVRKELSESGVARDRLCIDITKTAFELSARLDPASARFVSRVVEWNGLWWDSDRIVVELDESFRGQTAPRRLTLRLENGVWLLDEPSY